MWGIELVRQGELPLKRQVYQSLRDRIISGQLKAGQALPSTREMSKNLRVSRNTVCEAYEMLIAEGFVLNRQGSPTRVADGLCVEKAPAPESSVGEVTRQKYRADFQTGRPDLSQFPRFLWQRMLYQASREIPVHQLDYSGPQGLPQLREEIAAWLFRSRGLMVDSQEVFITAGATHALHLIVNLLYREGKEILIEDPCHIGMLQTILNRGCRVVPVPVDKHGLRTELLGGNSARAVYVTPSHQFPLGGILPAGRRAALIQFARENGSYIVEDDYDSEFRYSGEPIAPLYAMDSQQVIYVGTFSKVLFPALRIGYVVLPKKLHRNWNDQRTHTDVQNPPFEQVAMAEFLRARKLDKHIRRMRRVYGERRQVLLEAMKEAFGGMWRVWGDAAGLHVAVEFPGMRFDGEFVEKSLRFGIRITPVENHCIRKGMHVDKLLIGYGHLEPDEIIKGIFLLRDFFKRDLWV
ncbi:MAG: PLP-dependent aminotransferase family protein [Dehalococcoidales bacterium]|nr:PLP-dependent aminotransferase family protein [Dehalococcoidales bacterium]